MTVRSAQRWGAQLWRIFRRAAPVLMIVLAVGLTWLTDATRRNRGVVRAVRERGGLVVRDDRPVAPPPARPPSPLEARIAAEFLNRLPVIYLDGKDDNVSIRGSVMNNNIAREGGGALFDVVDSGWGALTFNQSDLHDNVSGKFETSPGVYYQLDGKDRAPVMIKSADG